MLVTSARIQRLGDIAATVPGVYSRVPLIPSSSQSRVRHEQQTCHSPDTCDSNHRLVEIIVVTNAIRIIQHSLARALRLGLRDRPAIPVHDRLLTACRCGSRQQSSRAALEHRACGKCGRPGVHGGDVDALSSSGAVSSRQARHSTAVAGVAPDSSSESMMIARNGRVIIGCDTLHVNCDACHSWNIYAHCTAFGGCPRSGGESRDLAAFSSQFANGTGHPSCGCFMSQDRVQCAGGPEESFVPSSDAAPCASDAKHPNTGGRRHALTAGAPDISAGRLFRRRRLPRSRSR